MNKLPKIIAGVVWILLPFFSPEEAFAVTVASQDQSYQNQLAVWQVMQELGTNLTGTADKFTFRVSTAYTNADQFDYTAQNSKIYDKSNNNSYIKGCVPSSANPTDKLRGLTFNTSGVPSGFEDVTIDFFCQNYSFIPGHKYLILINNANMPSYGGLTIRFAAASYANATDDLFTLGGVRYGNGNVYDYSNNSGSCDPAAYTWGGTNVWHNGCYVWGIAQNDLYFVLTNNAPPPPPPKLPVVFIPGIGGSELKATQDIVWSKDNGHGGAYSHAYVSNEKIWVNQDEAVKLGDDDYFDVLKLKPDGVTSEVDLSLTNNLTSFGYSDIDPFFIGMGYVKGTNFFVFNYDWRKDVRGNKDALDSLIEQAKTSSGQSKVNLVVHSMGGLIARYYISDSSKASKVNKLIELGVPHLGTVDGLKVIMYGKALGRPLFGNFILGVAASEIKDISQNSPSMFQLLPFLQYFIFYNSDKDRPYPFRDDRDIDNNKITGVLNYDQTKSLLTNLSYNMTAFNLGEQLHTGIDANYNQTNGVKVYEIAGSSQPTLGQIAESWWITWPVNLIPKRDEIFINGDDTVPLYSASLKSESQDLSGATKIYYVEQKHADLVSQNGTAMQTVKSILNDDNSLPVEVKDQKISLEGQQISVDQNANLDLYDDSNNHTGLNSSGDVETNIPNTFYDSLDDTKHIFVKKKANKVTAKITSSKNTKVKVKIRNYSQDSINKTTFYNDVSVNDSLTVQFVIDPNSQNTPTLTSGTQIITTSSEATGSAALDQTPPSTTIQISGTKDASGIYTGPVTISLTGNDSESGILRIEYSLDNGQTIQTYSNPFIISTPGKTTMQVKSIDKLGNEEIPQTITIEIATPSTVNSSTSGTTSSTSSSSDTSTNTTSSSSSNTSSVITSEDKQSSSISSPPEILGIQFSNPSHISDEINTTNLLKTEEPQNPKPSYITKPPIQQILGGLLVVSGGIVAIASLGFAFTFIQPIPK